MANNEIEIVGLGGLDDKGKNCIVITINGDSYIINCGMMIPSTATLGVTGIIPDFSYLQNKKIKGIFVTTPYFENTGGILFLMKQLAYYAKYNGNQSPIDEMGSDNSKPIDLPIYCSDISKKIIATNYPELDKQLKPLNSMTETVINTIKVIPFRIFNSLPGSLGYIIQVGNDNIVICDNHIVSSESDLFNKNNILDLAPYLVKKNNILLLAASTNITKTDFANPNYIGYHALTNFLSAKKRMFVALYSHEFYKIKTIIDLCIEHDHPICFLNNKTLEIVKYLIEKKYLSDKIKIIDKAASDKYNNIVYIISGEKTELFDMVHAIAHNDTDIKINQDDSFIFGTYTIVGYEKKEADMFDELNKVGIKTVSKLSNDVIPMLPCIEDLKLVVGIVKPKYFIPFNGLYMYFTLLCRAASTFVDVNNMILAINGQKLFFENGTYLPNKRELLTLESQPVNVTGNIDTGGEMILNERKMMQTNGAVLVSFLVGQSTLKITNCNLDSVGVIDLNEENKGYVNTFKEKLKVDINNYFVSQDKSNFGSYDYDRALKAFTRKLVEKFFQQQFDKRPLVVTNFIFVNTPTNN